MITVKKMLVLSFFLFSVHMALSQSKLKDGFVVTSDKVKIHYVEAGRGEPILFVPGWTMTTDIWEQQIRHFAKTHRVIAMDPRSQGKSQKVGDGHYPERRAKDMYELVQQLKLSPVVLVGWSLAVPEVLTYVDEFGTATLRSLVLVDGYIGADADSCAPDPLKGMLKAVHENREQHTAAFVRSMFKSKQPEAYLAKITRAALQTPTNTAFTLLAHLMVTEGDWRPALKKVDKPLLYVVTPSLAFQAEMVKQTVPAAQTEVFENAGHAVFVDEADKFNALLEAFINKTR
jgi:non-heme chloroperoxidase